MIEIQYQRVKLEEVMGHVYIVIKYYKRTLDVETKKFHSTSKTRKIKQIKSEKSSLNSNANTTREVRKFLHFYNELESSADSKTKKDALNSIRTNGLDTPKSLRKDNDFTRYQSLKNSETKN